ncbi:hypothetical protein QR680_013218 [Steinernema hermaphroditum]|uniref:Uncharacterized protein n=1 Tax=Steinernema hermaphroditum TaxID=289476 RepID=A0AA39M242_9BILA|nr:hypothetical protein QR680_013218 [Steinernema hermaphroditum]
MLPDAVASPASPPPKPKRRFSPLSLSADDLVDRKKRIAHREMKKSLLPSTPLSPPGFYDNLRAVRVQSRRLTNRRRSSRQLVAAPFLKVDLKGKQSAFKNRNKKQLLLKVERCPGKDGVVSLDRTPYTASPIPLRSEENHFLSPVSPKKHRLFGGFKKGNVSPSRSVVSARELFTLSPIRFLKNASSTVSRTFSSPKKKSCASTHDLLNLDPSAKWYSPFKSPATLLVTAWKQKKDFGSNSSLVMTAPATTSSPTEKQKTSRSLSTPNACAPHETKFSFLLQTSTEDFCCSTDCLSLYDEIEQVTFPGRELTPLQCQQLEKSIPDQEIFEEMDHPRGLLQKFSETHHLPRKCSTVLEIEPAVLGTCVEMPFSRRPSEESVPKSPSFEARSSVSPASLPLRGRRPGASDAAPSPNDDRLKSVAELTTFFSRL